MHGRMAMAFRGVVRVHGISAFLCMVLAMSLYGPPAAAQLCARDGNVDQEDGITPVDALLAFQHFLGIANPPLDTCQQERADVNQDGSITPSDGLCIFRRFLGVESCLNNVPPVVNARLLEVAGNNQAVAPGTELTVPLVVRIEDDFGNPLAGVEVRAEIVQGDAVFVSSSSPLVQFLRFAALLAQNGTSTTAVAVTDANGEARFFLRAGPSPQDIVTRVSFLDQTVEFTTTVVSEVRDCDPEPTNMVINFGNSIVNCEINPTTDLDRFSFAGEAGDEIRLTVRSTSGRLDPQVELRAPDGTVVGIHQGVGGLS